LLKKRHHPGLSDRSNIKSGGAIYCYKPDIASLATNDNHNCIIAAHNLILVDIKTNASVININCELHLFGDMNSFFLYALRITWLAANISKYKFSKQLGLDDESKESPPLS
jgi:hypothetical protein